MARLARPAIDRRGIGLAAEDLAANHLTAEGARILYRNYRRRMGELDLVAREGSMLLVVEVRTRSSEAYGGAAASVSGAKRRRIVRVTRDLLQRHRELAGLRVRFDVVVVRAHSAAEPRVEWIRGAFEAAD